MTWNLWRELKRNREDIVSVWKRSFRGRLYIVTPERLLTSSIPVRDRYCAAKTEWIIWWSEVRSRRVSRNVILYPLCLSLIFWGMRSVQWFSCCRVERRVWQLTPIDNKIVKCSLLIKKTPTHYPSAVDY